LEAEDPSHEPTTNTFEKEDRNELELRTLSLSLDSLKRAKRRQVIDNQFAADWPLRVIAEGSGGASPTTRAQGAKGEWL
jgi:hypothetical protein